MPEKRPARVGKVGGVQYVDARIDRSSPINIAAFLYRNNGNKLQYPAFTVKTVYKGADFSGNIYKHENIEKIFLY